MSRRQRPLRRLASQRAARRRRHVLAPPERLPAPVLREELIREPIPPLPERFEDCVEIEPVKA